MFKFQKLSSKARTVLLKNVFILSFSVIVLPCSGRKTSLRTSP